MLYGLILVPGLFMYGTVRVRPNSNFGRKNSAVFRFHRKVLFDSHGDVKWVVFVISVEQNFCDSRLTQLPTLVWPHLNICKHVTVEILKSDAAG